MQNRIKAVLFDIDGTLLDFDACVEETMEEGFAAFGIGSYEPSMMQTFASVNNALWQQLERKEITREELLAVRWQRIFERLGLQGDGPRFEEYFREKLFYSGILIPGAMELLESLNGRYELAVASNGPYEQQISRLTTAGMKMYFNYFFISEKIGVLKPDPRFFEVCLREINERRAREGKEAVSPDEVLMVGDSLTSDMDGGIRSGLLTCFVDRFGKGQGDRPVNWTVRSLDELAQLLE